MDAYEKDILIDELQRLIVDKATKSRLKDIEIASLKREVERLEHLLTPKI